VLDDRHSVTQYSCASEHALAIRQHGELARQRATPRAVAREETTKQILKMDYRNMYARVN
jgi:hypothetical protein